MAVILLSLLLGGTSSLSRAGLRLRHARPSDLRSIADLLAAPAAPAAEPSGTFDWGAQPEVARFCAALPPRLAPASDHLFAVVADEADAVVGCAELGMMPVPDGYAAPPGVRVAYIGNVAVDTKMRRRGVATQLVGFAIKWARSQWRRADVFTHVEAHNAPARALYDGLGFAAFSPDAGVASGPAADGGRGEGQGGARGAGSSGPAGGQVLLVRRGELPGPAAAAARGGPG